MFVFLNGSNTVKNVMIKPSINQLFNSDIHHINFIIEQAVWLWFQFGRHPNTLPFSSPVCGAPHLRLPATQAGWYKVLRMPVGGRERQEPESLSYNLYP